MSAWLTAKARMLPNATPPIGVVVLPPKTSHAVSVVQLPPFLAGLGVVVPPPQQAMSVYSRCCGPTATWPPSPPALDQPVSVYPVETVLTVLREKAKPSQKPMPTAKSSE